jgi:dTDP-4-amino-4,6-dideoxygalactose transaminase
MNILLNKPVAPCLDTLNKYLSDINESGWYTNFGPLHQKLTQRLQDYLGVENLLLVSNGTIALHIAYRALDIKNTICTPFSFVATAASLDWEKIPMTFVDIDHETLNLCPQLVQKELLNRSEIDSIVATHVYGNPCNVESFEELQRNHKVRIIYDGAHAFKINLGQNSILKYGDASTLSFHATKVFHTIEGGAVVFRDKEAFEKAEQIINFGFEPSGRVGKLGINAKLNEYQSAVGLTLLDSIDDVLSHRVELFNLYQSHLNNYVKLQIWHEEASHNGAYLPIILNTSDEKKLIKAALQDAGVPTREYFSPSLNKIFCPSDKCLISESVSSRVLCLPIHFYMTTQEVIRISELIKREIK